MQLADLNSKPRGGKSLKDIIDRAIGVHLYLPPGSEHYKLLCLNIFLGSTQHGTPLNDKHSKSDDKRLL